MSGLCWWGAYGRAVPGGFEDCRGAGPDAFLVRYYQNNNGVPGQLVASFNQLQIPPTLTVSAPFATGALVADEVPEYEFSATHAAFPVNAGQCYWVEISNLLAPDCVFFWEMALAGNGWSMQDGDGANAPNGYALADVTGNDFAFCLNQPLGNAVPCSPPGPPNNDCTGATQITGVGTFLFDNRESRTERQRVADCYPSHDTRLEGDVWYCWTASCNGPVLVTTCDSADEDTLIAVSNGCSVCPPSPSQLLACNDDRCGSGDPPLQSMAVFDAVQGQRYLIRVGTHPDTPRGTGAIAIRCGPPNNLMCGPPNVNDCCTDSSTPTDPGSPGCADDLCCELVCACDPMCCGGIWDEFCAGSGFHNSGCGAELLCPEDCVICGSPLAGPCCDAGPGRGCNNAACCEAVCACDSYCCDTNWDDNCATFGFQGSGCGAQALCSELCAAPACPSGSVTFIDPVPGTVDARQAHSETDVSARRGLRTFVVSAPTGAEDPADCWSVSCETIEEGGPNQIESVVDNGGGAFTITLMRPISAGAVTRITYTDSDSLATSGRFLSHSANVNADAQANFADVSALVLILEGSALPVYGLISADVDFSGVLTGKDLLRLGDLLNGGFPFASWINTPLPNGCP